MLRHAGRIRRIRLASYAYNGARQRVAKTVHPAGQDAAGSTTYYNTWHKGLLDAERGGAGQDKTELYRE